MTIPNLSRFLIFDQKTEVKKCLSCNGTGKIESSSKTSTGTVIFCTLVATTLGLSLVDMLGSTPNYFISIPLFIGSAILWMATLAEYKQQTDQQTVENKK